MEFVTVVITAMGLLTRPAFGSPAPEPVEDIQARACVSIEVFQESDYKGASYSEFLRPDHVYPIRPGFRHNVGSFRMNTRGYTCIPRTPEDASCVGANWGARGRQTA